jgi:oligosaccharide repeat unit polymerase
VREVFDLRRGALLGCVLSLVGTYVASVMLFPADPSPQGALVVPGTVLALFLIAIPVLRMISGSATATNAENFVAFGFVFWLLLDLIQGAYELTGATSRGLQQAMVAVGVSAAAMWLGAGMRPWRLPQWIVEGASRHLDSEAVAKAVPICLLLGMFNYMYSVDFDLPAMFSYLGEQRWAAPWGRGQLGGWEAFRDQAPYFGYVLPSLAALLIARDGLFRFRSLFAIAASVLMLVFLASGGGRRIVGVTVGAALMVYVQTNANRRISNMVVVAASAVALAWTAQFMLNIRTFGYEQFKEEGSSYDYLHVDDNYLRLAQIIDIVPRKRDYVYSKQIVFTLVRPVPRVFWPGKPTSPGFDLPTEVGLKGVSLSSSIIGEWYLSWGWWAVVFGGWLHGRLASTANALREIGARFGNPIIFSLSVMVLLAGMRSMQDLVLMSYALVAWWGVSRLMLSRTTPLAA